VTDSAGHKNVAAKARHSALWDGLLGVRKKLIKRGVSLIAGMVI
jgi:hypothetical protein